MFSDRLTFAIVTAAKANGIEPAALLALVEVETDGDAFEPADGRTPRLLFERHVAYREAGKVSAELRAKFVAAGLAIPKWSRSTQYKDQGTSAKRLEIMRRARAIDDEVALRSASHGVGQTMGFLAEELGFESARAMYGTMVGSLPGQIECMIRELKRSNLIKPMNAGDWTRVARIYNGPGYAQNSYDTRMANACARWRRRLPTIMPNGEPRELPPEQELSREEIRLVQELLRRLGYHEVGAPDGVWGSRTTGALSAFQAHEGLPVTGHYDDATRAALATADKRPTAPAREAATVDELAEAGSRTVKDAKQLTFMGRLLKWLGFGTGGAYLADESGGLESVKSWVMQSDLHEVLTLLGKAGGWLVAHWWIAAILLGLFIVWRANRIAAARLEDHQTGRHAGPVES
jgi:hypothetical protein